jgi:hypothetical protein
MVSDAFIDDSPQDFRSKNGILIHVKRFHQRGKERNNVDSAKLSIGEDADADF